ncbi:hypothetical protein K501DRAFT_273849 [Backusella circina FSU 941]|nr:hypothetical protein K501DRAFT_273849 [Backusella circina FSU 941]
MRSASISNTLFRRSPRSSNLLAFALVIHYKTLDKSDTLSYKKKKKNCTGVAQLGQEISPDKKNSGGKLGAPIIAAIAKKASFPSTSTFMCYRRHLDDPDHKIPVTAAVYNYPTQNQSTTSLVLSRETASRYYTQYINHPQRKTPLSHSREYAEKPIKDEVKREDAEYKKVVGHSGSEGEICRLEFWRISLPLNRWHKP